MGCNGACKSDRTCTCGDDQRQHDRNSCTRPGCSCGKTYNDVGKDARARREKGGRFDRG